MSNSLPHLDETDRAILRHLQADGALSNVRLAEAIGLSPAATLARVKKLEQDQIIQGYTALVDRERLGFDLMCFVQVSLESHDVAFVEAFRNTIRAMPEVIECHFLTGQADYLLKVVVKNRKALEHFLVQKLTPVAGVSRLQTSLVLSEVKTHGNLMLADDEV